MVDEPVLDSSQRRFSHEQKIGIGLLFVFSVVSVSMGMLQIRNRLYKPFALNNQVPAGLKEEINTPEALRFRDTDFDGLNDFDEMYLHGTSPYLSDTDSDGMNDKEEIFGGTNPLCAKDKPCDVVEVETNGLEGQVAPSSYGLGEEVPGNIDDLLNDPAYFRQVLIKNGVKKELIDKMSDKDILAMVNQVLQSTSTSR